MYNIYEDLASEFETRVYQWKVDGKFITPTAADIEKLVDNAVTALYSEPDGSCFERGRLIVQKNGTKYDVYLHYGEVK